MKKGHGPCTGCLFLFILVCILLADRAFAESRFRLMGGIGRTETGYDFPQIDRTSFGYGAQLLTSVSNDRAYGIEMDRHSFFKSGLKNGEYISVGIVLEAMLYGIWLNQMGTVGYVGVGDNQNNPFGFRASTGFEFPWGRRFTFSTLLRNDIVFEEKSIFSTRFEAGIGFKF